MKSSVSERKQENPVWQPVSQNLVRYNPSGVYYARVRVKGKLKVRSLQTKNADVAKRKLRDFENEERAKADRTSTLPSEKGKAPSFGELLELLAKNKFRPLRARTPKDKIPLKPATIEYYKQRRIALRESWPALEETPVNRLTLQQFDEWSARQEEEMSGSAFNHTITLLRWVLDIAVQKSLVYENLAARLVRKRETPKKPVIPSPETFQRILREMETSGSGHSQPCADLARFLAYGGFRVNSEARWITWADCDYERRRIHVRGNPETGTKGSDRLERWVPMIPEMRELLLKLRDRRRNEPDTTPVMEVFECQKALDRATRIVAMITHTAQQTGRSYEECDRILSTPRHPQFGDMKKVFDSFREQGKPALRLTHHDLRDIFTTQCIEAGVPIPTVAKWLGHKDGGALLMRTYAHLRDTHSADMAKRVSFGVVKPENVVQLKLAV